MSKSSDLIIFIFCSNILNNKQSPRRERARKNLMKRTFVVFSLVFDTSPHTHTHKHISNSKIKGFSACSLFFCNSRSNFYTAI